ncbi:MMPL family transporter [Rhodococcus sp. D2-41]|uniref:MMPL family transporter n=1 Tax=Speluncibacter jeojiensis TaxID=2710754 RepID=A0A9X4M558_9ACTN|nr:MMPL family transporter [Rhodococcus sp. D2-41]MDG3012928.1 MMPL family transporter [Rhodococcus sp. D2-41]MDG3017027.1 MMPL family transporter [Corynebacteriales bacterium D3-21]
MRRASGGPSWAHRWGVFVARHRWPVLGCWLIVLIACALAYPQLSGNLQGSDYNVTGSDSAHVQQLMHEHFADMGTEQDAVVFDASTLTVDDPQYRRAVAHTLDAVRAGPGVVGVIGPFDPFAAGQISADRRSAIAVVGMGGTSRTNITDAKRLQDIVGATSTADVRASLTGFSPLTNDLGVVEKADAERGESIGLPVALIVLIVALGAVVAGLLPLVAAGAGLLCAFGVLTALSTVLSFDTLLVVIATMIGTGIGIDYALFVVGRVREEMTRRGVVDRRRADRHQTDAIAESIGVGMQTAGKTIAISGMILTIAICALLVIGSPVFHEITIGVVVTVLSVLAVALSFLPALLAVLGPRVNTLALPARLRPAEVGDTSTRGAWARWAHAVMRRPALYGGLVAAVLVVALLPVTGLRYGIDLGTAALDHTPSGHANTILAQKFSPGMLAPVEIVATGPDDGPVQPSGRAATDRMAQVLAHDPRIAGVLPREENGRMLWIAAPKVPVDSTAAADLARDLRGRADEAAAGKSTRILVGGTTAQFVDLSDETTSALPWVLTIVLLLSLIFLAVAFRSAVLPVKAVLMNLLATGAALGITVAIFQWGWGSSLLGFQSVGYLQVYLPVTVFVVLFGLSMDYEVFLIGRMKEAWDRRTAEAADLPDRPDGDPDARNVESVAEGLEHTARPITAAAAIMVVVFAGFISADVLELKQFGVALSVAIAIDAVLVRMILVPAFMKLLGHRNWWPGTRIRAGHPDPADVPPVRHRPPRLSPSWRP